ncbi:MAG TPA: hypothetical protein PKB15_00415 [Acidimicrobiia bacterium]|nr:hypothetical protein [Acidimicrobiia bacterium]
MNTQLSLIDLSQVTVTSLNTGFSETKSGKKGRKSRAQRTEQWWKLSKEERKQGLAGVRAIRAILQQSDLEGEPHNIMATAS